MVAWLAVARALGLETRLGLGSQASGVRRQSTSVALNGSEGVWAKAGKRRSRLEDAVNSARETLMALRLAGACGYLPADEAAGNGARG